MRQRRRAFPRSNAQVNARGPTGSSYSRPRVRRNSLSPPPEIARIALAALPEQLQNPHWWAQSVAIAFEQHVGLRVPGQSSTGDFRVSASRTMSCDRDEAVARWIARFAGSPHLGHEVQSARQSRTEKRTFWRATLDGAGKLEVAAEAKPHARSLIFELECAAYNRAPNATLKRMSESQEMTPELLAKAAAKVIAERSGVATHDIALTLGSGWGKAATAIGEVVSEIAAEDVPGFHKAAVVGHGGKLTSIRMNDGRHALVIGARTHFYEGHGVRAVVHGVRTAAATGAKTMVLTNGAGGVDPSFTPGKPVLISDHINLTAASPIEGANFVDLTDLYSPRLRDLARTIDPSLNEGVYVQFTGPHYETPAEVRYAGIIGGHIVGMSTALEAIAARQSGMEVLGFSLITNAAAGISETPLSHEEVLEAGREAEPKLAALLAELVPLLP